jgi:hypothetical protein
MEGLAALPLSAPVVPLAAGFPKEKLEGCAAPAVACFAPNRLGAAVLEAGVVEPPKRVEVPVEAAPNSGFAAGVVEPEFALLVAFPNKLPPVFAVPKGDCLGVSLPEGWPNVKDMVRAESDS